jgi:hypothetical protein
MICKLFVGYKMMRDFWTRQFSVTTARLMSVVRSMPTTAGSGELLICDYSSLGTRPANHSVTCGTFMSTDYTRKYNLLYLQQRSRYSDWIRAGRPRGPSSSSDMVKNFRFSTSSRQALGPTQPPIQWVRGALPLEVKRPRRDADHSSPARGLPANGFLGFLPWGKAAGA